MNGCAKDLRTRKTWYTSLLLTLQADLEAQERDSWGAKILLLPTVIMNDNQYRGRLDTPSIVRALCSGFKESSEPDVRAASLSQYTFASHLVSGICQ